MANIQPLGHRVLVKRTAAEEMSTGGIVLPGTALEKPQEAEVVALGVGGKDDKGNAYEFTVQVGQIVLISKYGGNEIHFGGEEHILIDEQEILGIIK